MLDQGGSTPKIVKPPRPTIASRSGSEPKAQQYYQPPPISQRSVSALERMGLQLGTSLANRWGMDVVTPIEEARKGNYYPAIQAEFRAIKGTLGSAALNPTIQEKAAVGLFNRVLQPGATAIAKFLGTYKPVTPASFTDVISPARWAMASGQSNFASNFASRALPVVAKANVWAGVAQMMGNLGGSTPTQSYLRQFRADRIRAAGQGPGW